MRRLNNVKAEGFGLEHEDRLEPTVSFQGTGDAFAVQPLNDFLSQLHEAMLEARESQVVVDVQNLYFMNSSCLKAFVSWIYKVQTAGEPYRIVVKLNARLPWQERSLDRVRELAPGIVTLRPVAEAER